MAIKQSLGEPVLLPDGSVAPFAPAFRAGELLFVSGQLAFAADGSIAGKGAYEQAQICLQHIDRIITDAGLQKTDIARVGIWLTNAADFAEFNRAYAEYFGDHRPARACVVSQLVLPDACVEIDAIAHF